ncbi:3-hydroxyisobutyryl- hydrolase 1 [Olea europaea subsp. europaea]|uniref:3-hydroxyisobutyryl-CoA hydrolase n=1 Tax=Olea europaea subsp. europaea TaxID=158383 RepID=A0A8S0VHV4_OLEEU|nr:3-hydroxyisobutyryl- hydrolase 1 [Olea europaea subsp. europaea]
MRTILEFGRQSLKRSKARTTMASIPFSFGETDQVLVEEKYSTRIFTLNRPNQLNAVSFPMVQFSISAIELFLACEEDHSVKLIILKGKGKAFCAGGDVAAVVRGITQASSNWRPGAIFFRRQYILNYVMATYNTLSNFTIPLQICMKVSILNGIVMGGGAGVSIHGRFCVATENSLFAMPETALGLFPDVGASYFLSRLPGFFGEYVGLTGARLDGAEMLACGLATHFVLSEKLSLLEDALYKADSSDPVVISATISEFSLAPNVKEKSAFHRLNIINKCFSCKTIEEIILALEREAADKDDEWISSTLQSLKKASPTSLKISLRSIREGRLQGLGKCLLREYGLVWTIMRGEINKDFFEGCRAILLDKDKNPKWEPAKLEQVTEDMVDRYFSKINDEDWEDLDLPRRSNIPPYAIAKLQILS